MIALNKITSLNILINKNYIPTTYISHYLARTEQILYFGYTRIMKHTYILILCKYVYVIHRNSQTNTKTMSMHTDTCLVCESNPQPQERHSVTLNTMPLMPSNTVGIPHTIQHNCKMSVQKHFAIDCILYDTACNIPCS